jgi:hypothetical protein
MRINITQTKHNILLVILDVGFYKTVYLYLILGVLDCSSFLYTGFFFGVDGPSSSSISLMDVIFLRVDYSLSNLSYFCI